MSSPVRKKLKKMRVVDSSSEEESGNESGSRSEEEQDADSDDSRHQSEASEAEEEEESGEESEGEGESLGSRDSSSSSSSEESDNDDDDDQEEGDQEEEMPPVSPVPSDLGELDMDPPDDMSVDEEEEMEAELRAMEALEVPDDLPDEQPAPSMLSSSSTNEGAVALESADTLSRAKELLGFITKEMEVNAQAIVLEDLDTFKRDYTRASVIVSPATALDVLGGMTLVQWKRTQAMYRKAYVTINKDPPRGTLDIHRFMHCMLRTAAKQFKVEDGAAWEGENSYLSYVPNIDIQHMPTLYRQRKLPRLGVPPVPSFHTPAASSSSSSAAPSSASVSAPSGEALLGALSIESGEAPRRTNRAFIPEGQTTVRHVCQELNLGRLADVLSHAETAVFNLYFSTYHRQPPLAPVGNVEYSEYLYNAEDTGLIMTGLSRALICLAAKAAETGVTRLVPDFEGANENDAALAEAQNIADEEAMERERQQEEASRAPPTLPSGGDRPTACVATFNMPGADASNQTGGAPTSGRGNRVRLPPDPPGQIRVGTVIDNMGLKARIMESSGMDRDDKYRFLDRVRMKAGSHMSAVDRQNKYNRERQEVNGRFVRVYRDSDKQELERCVQLALADANAEFGVNITLDN